jgi:hypothetical protein
MQEDLFLILKFPNLSIKCCALQNLFAAGLQYGQTLWPSTRRNQAFLVFDARPVI